MRQRSAVRISMDKPRSGSSAGEAATRLAASAIRKAASAARRRGASMSARGYSAWREAQQPAHHRRLAGLGLGVDLEGERAASERRGVERAPPQTRVGLGEIIEAAIGQRLVKLDREALAWAVLALDDKGATPSGADLRNLDDRRQRVDGRFEGGVLQAERRGSAGIGLRGAELHVAAIAGHFGADDPAAFHVALVRSDMDCSAGDGLVLARLQIAQHQNVAR